MLEAIQGIEGDPVVYLNGQHLPLSQAQVSVLDRGFIFGDGIYEVVPIYYRKPFRMQEHLDRLDRSLAKLDIVRPLTRDQWQTLIKTLLAQQPLRDHDMVYLQVTRGVAKRDHAFPQPSVTPTVFAMVSPMTPPSQAVRTQGLRAISIPDMRWLHCDIKSVSLLGNVLAKQAAINAGVEEVIQFRDAVMTEGAACNVWLVEDGKVVGAPKDNRVLEGIRYGLFQELCEQCELELVLEPVSQQRVAKAQEIMVSSATREVLPVVQFDGKAVGSGQPGPVFKLLRQAYDQRIAALRLTQGFDE
jgi:D-alanine transaminase